LRVSAEPEARVDLEPPRAVVAIARRLDERGFEAWAVGGAVRDNLIGRSGSDWDLATDATPDQVRRVFRRTVPIGIEHGTVGVLAGDAVMYEVTTFRQDVETDGRHAVVRFAKTLEEDLARRDFTINAVAWNPITHEFRDPFGGAADLGVGVLRTVGDPERRFAEDYLRVLRALRFAGHFGLRIDDDTRRALTDAVTHLDILSPERIREEIVKVLSKTRLASDTLELYADTGVLARLLPELEATRGLEVHDGTDAWQLAIRSVDAVPRTRLRLRLASLLHTVGYPLAKARDLRGGFRYTGNERMGARAAEAILNRLRSSNAETARVVAIVAHQSDLFPPDAPDAAVRRWLADVGPDLVNDLFRLRIARQRAAPIERAQDDIIERWRIAHRIIHEDPALTVDRLAIDGNDLRDAGLEPGPRFGEILRDLLLRVIDDPVLNDRATLLDIVRREHTGA
jgi:tRNA nucleotidyltransferase (CCA-adding enzyme)